MVEAVMQTLALGWPKLGVSSILQLHRGSGQVVTVALSVLSGATGAALLG